MEFLIGSVAIAAIIIAVAAVIEQIRLYKERHKDSDN